MWLQHIFKNIVKVVRRSGPAANHTLPDQELRLSWRAFRQLNRLQLNASRYLSGYTFGQRPSLRRRPSVDFHEHRAYVAGDDVRFVDWKASARQEHIFIKQGQQPKEANIYILLDVSASMAWGEPPKADTMLQLALALSYLALSESDRLVLAILSQTGVTMFGPVNGKGQYPAVVRFLQKVSFGGKLNLEESLLDFRRKLVGHGGMVLLLSDFLDAGHIGKALKLLPAPGWDVVVLHLLHREELEPHLRGEYEIVDIETDNKSNYDLTEDALRSYQENLQGWLDSLESTCVQQNAFYARLPTDWTLDVDIIPYLRDLEVLRPA